MKEEMQAEPPTRREEDTFRGFIIKRQTCLSPKSQVRCSNLWDYNTRLTDQKPNLQNMSRGNNKDYITDNINPYLKI